MAQIKVRGIVLEQAPMGEKDKRLVVLTREMGKISVLAKGAKSQAGRQAAPAQLFCVADYVLDRGKTFYYIKEYEILGSFYSLRTDLDRFAYASVMLEFARIFSLDGEENESLFTLLVRGLYAMQKEKVDYRTICHTYLLRLLSENGFQPELSSCTRCGRSYDQTEGWFFNAEEGGLVCPECHRFEKSEVSPGTVRAMQYIISAEQASVYRFSAAENLQRELVRPIRESAILHAGFTPKSLDFVENLENMG